MYVIQYVNVCIWFFSIQTGECVNSPICDILQVHVTWVREKKIGGVMSILMLENKINEINEK